MKRVLLSDLSTFVYLPELAEAEGMETTWHLAGHYRQMFGGRISFAPPQVCDILDLVSTQTDLPLRAWNNMRRRVMFVWPEQSKETIEWFAIQQATQTEKIFLRQRGVLDNAVALVKSPDVVGGFEGVEGICWRMPKFLYEASSDRENALRAARHFSRPVRALTNVEPLDRSHEAPDKGIAAWIP